MRLPHSPHRAAGAIVLAAAFLAAGATPAAADVTTELSRGALRVASDGESDTVTLHRDPVDDDLVLVTVGGAADTRAFERQTFLRIQVEGGGGDDTVNVGPGITDTEPTTVLLGDGADTFNGSSGPETVLGGLGDDTLLGGAGTDTLAGEADDDHIDGGADADFVSGGAGADVLVRGPRGAEDGISGGPGTDTFEAGGSDGDDVFGITVARPTLVVEYQHETAKIAPADVEIVRVVARGGNDRVASASELPVSLELLGGPGDDALTSGNHDDVVDGGEGSDDLFVAGGRDVVTGGPGADTFECEDGPHALRDLEAGETQTNCVAAADPVGPPGGGGEPGAGVPDGAPGAGLPSLPDGGGSELPAGFLGFAKPTVQIARGGLKVTIRNTHTAPIPVAVSGSEKRGRKRQRYRRVVKLIAPGRRVTIRLRASRSYLRARGKRKAAVTVANLTTSGKVTLRR